MRGPDRRPRRLRRERLPASATAENARRVDIRKWKRGGLLVIGFTFRHVWPRTGESLFVTRQARSVQLAWQDDHGRKLMQPVRLIEHDRIVRGYIRGGARAYRRGVQRVFRCSGCGRGCCLLYLGVRGWTCRQCAGLRYVVECLHDKARRKKCLLKIQRQLGMNADKVADSPRRPARMRRTTFEAYQRRFWRVRTRWKLGLTEGQMKKHLETGRGRGW
jgi:hypothetical protein